MAMSARTAPAHAPDPDTMTAESQHFRFLDLSAELRNNVYELLLQHPEAIRLGTIIDVHVILLEWVRIPRIGMMDDFQKSHTSRKNVALLRTNRQIHDEATPILYRTNSFVFNDKDLLCSFFNKIGQSIGLLRHVTISWSNKTSIRPMLVSLKKATHLDHLDIGYFARKEIGDAARMAKEIGPWVRAFHKMRKGNTHDGHSDALDVLNFTTRTIGTADENDEDIVIAADYSAHVKSLLEKTLKG